MRAKELGSETVSWWQKLGNVGDSSLTLAIAVVVAVLLGYEKGEGNGVSIGGWAPVQGGVDECRAERKEAGLKVGSPGKLLAMGGSGG